MATKAKHVVVGHEGGMDDDPPSVEAVLESAARALESHPDYRVLRRLRTPESYGPLVGEAHTGLFVDVETTSPFPESAKVIELGIARFSFDSQGHIGTVGPNYRHYEDPGEPLAPEIVRLTGICDALLENQCIDDGEVEAWVENAALIVAHSARFDRQAMERRFPKIGLQGKPWACSQEDVCWDKFGVRGLKLDYLLQVAARTFHQAHSALDDALAGVHLLAQPALPIEGQPELALGQTNLSYLLDSVRAPCWKVSAWDSPYETKDILRQRQYRWDTDRRVWAGYTRDLSAEMEWLSANVYDGRKGGQAVPISAKDRYSVRG